MRKYIIQLLELPDDIYALGRKAKAQPLKLKTLVSHPGKAVLPVDIGHDGLYTGEDASFLYLSYYSYYKLAPPDNKQFWIVTLHPGKAPDRNILWKLSSQVVNRKLILSVVSTSLDIDTMDVNLQRCHLLAVCKFASKVEAKILLLQADRAKLLLRPL